MHGRTRPPSAERPGRRSSGTTPAAGSARTERFSRSGRPAPSSSPSSTSRARSSKRTWCRLGSCRRRSRRCPGLETQPPRPVAWSDSLLPAATRLLVLAVAAEFLVLRILNRMTGSFPAWAREQVAVDLVLVGTVAYNFAYLLSILVLAAVGHF